MRSVFRAVLLTASFTSLTLGQTIEVFGGFSANKFFYSESTGEAFNPNANLASFFDFGADRHQGFDVSIAGNFTRYLGVKADYSMYFRQDSGKTVDALNYRVPVRPFNFMVGPEIKARNHTRLTPFAHALFGFAHSRADLIVEEALAQSHSRTGLAMAIGGGVDFRLTRMWSVRYMTDYTATHLGNPSPDDSGRQNNIRFALGVIAHFR
jgi:opacity protein-like surface antigen